MLPRPGSAAPIVALALLVGCGDDDSTTDTSPVVADAGDPAPVEPDGSEPSDAEETTETDTETETETETAFPDIIAAEPTLDADGTWSFAVTVSSPYDSAEQYADGWRIVGADGTVYGEHQLAHDHANEQPFTRRQSGVEIPETVDEVTIEGRDQVNGFGGRTLTVVLDRG